MHKKISIGLTVAIAVLAIMATALITTAVTMNIYSTLVSDLPEREAMYSSLAEIDSLIRREYYGTVEEESLNGAITDSYLSSLTVGNNYIMSAEEYSAYKLSQSGTDKQGNEIKSVSYKKHSSVGYIRISDFTETTPSEFSAAVTSLKNDAITGLVIDVRDTDSINIKSAAEVIDKIVPLASTGTKSIATAVDKSNTNTAVFSSDAESISLPVSVIVNSNTSGAGELLACDVRDFGKGTIVGKATAGNGSYQKIFELSDGRAMVLTVARLLPYKSECYDGTGVKPDYVVDGNMNDDLKKDNQFMQAYAAVTAMQ